MRKTDAEAHVVERVGLGLAVGREGVAVGADLLLLAPFGASVLEPDLERKGNYWVYQCSVLGILLRLAKLFLVHQMSKYLLNKYDHIC